MRPLPGEVCCGWRVPFYWPAEVSDQNVASNHRIREEEPEQEHKS